MRRAEWTFSDSISMRNFCWVGSGGVMRVQNQTNTMICKGQAGYAQTYYGISSQTKKKKNGTMAHKVCKNWSGLPQWLLNQKNCSKRIQTYTWMSLFIAWLTGIQSINLSCSKIHHHRHRDDDPSWWVIQNSQRKEAYGIIWNCMWMQPKNLSTIVCLK